MAWKFWLRKKEHDPNKDDVLTEMAELMLKAQTEAAKPMLFVLRDDAMKELNAKSKEYTHGIFGSEHHEGLTTVKKVFEVPVGFGVNLQKHRAILYILRSDEIMHISRGQSL